MSGSTGSMFRQNRDSVSDMRYSDFFLQNMTKHFKLRVIIDNGIMPLLFVPPESDLPG
jgi:hypothetical protein